MESSHEIGRKGEDAAAELLERGGWTILARNFRLGHKEIDLIVRRDRLVAFVEVKSRAGLRFGHPLESITRAKRAEIERVARAWVAAHGRNGDLYRFDAVSILWRGNAPPKVEHIPDAWRL